MNFKKWVAIWKSERDAVIRKQDVEMFKAFYKKWQNRGIYQMKIPSDNVIEVSLRKMLYNLADATEEEKATAKAWLTERGYDTRMD